MRTKENPKVSVIMNCLNGEKYLREAIDSVYNQTYKDWEIVFWNNASTDESGKIARSYDKRLKYFKEGETIPLGAARNKAIENSQGEFIAFLDSDDLWMPEKLEKQVNLMKENKEIVVCYSDGYYLIDTNRTKIKFSDSIFSRYHKGDVFNKLICRNFINWQSVLINTKLAGQNIYFNSAFNYSEDYDLLLRLSLLGKFDYICEPLIYYRKHKGNISRDLQKSLKETRLIFDLYEIRIEEYNINMKNVIGSLYGSMVLNLSRQGRKAEANEQAHYLLEYNSSVNIIIYLLLKLRLDFLFHHKNMNIIRKLGIFFLKLPRRLFSAIPWH